MKREVRIGRGNATRKGIGNTMGIAHEMVHQAGIGGMSAIVKNVISKYKAKEIHTRERNGERIKIEKEDRVKKITVARGILKKLCKMSNTAGVSTICSST